MPETYEEIIEEIETLAEEAVRYPTILYRDKYELGGSGPTEESYEIEVLKHLCARIREAVGGDPSEWYVLDADGNKVHKDDTVKLGVSEFKVICVGITNGKPSFCYRDNDGWLYIACAHKVVPDTREKIIEDTLAKLTPYGVGGGKVAEAIEDAVDRAMKLTEVDA